MDVLQELGHLIVATLRLWLRRFPTIAAWLFLGWGARELATFASVLMAGKLIPAMLLLVLGMVVWTISIVMVLHTLADPKHSDEPGESPERDIGRREVLLTAVLPFLAVYAAWGLTEEHIRRAFSANLVFHGTDTQNFSITYAAWHLYLAFAVGAWLAQAVLGLILRLAPRASESVLLTLLMTFLRGASLLAAFIGVSEVLTFAQIWANDRVFWRWLEDAWFAFIGFLPEWTLPWGLTLPEAVAALGRATWEYLVPGFLTAVLLPLVWLSLTAMVSGSHGFGRESDRLRAPEWVTARVDRYRAERSPLALAARWVWALVEDLLPAVTAFRVTLKSGLPFLAAFLLLGAAVRAAEQWGFNALMHLIGPGEFAENVVSMTFAQLLAEVLAWTLACCFFVVAFRRAMRRGVTAEGGLPRHSDQGSAASPPPPRPAEPARSMLP